MAFYSWVMDSGGAGRGAWQGGVLFEFLHWARLENCLPRISMGASAGGYAAADVATGTPDTVLKGWKRWGLEAVPDRRHEPAEFRSLGGWSRFRSHLYHSIRYVMSAQEVNAVFDTPATTRTRLAIFTTRVRRRDDRRFTPRDSQHYFLKSITRKLPRVLKYLPAMYAEDPVVFVSHLPASQASEFVRPLTRVNYHNAIEASCLIPFAMGEPIRPEELLPVWRGIDPLQRHACADDAVWEELAAPYRFSGDGNAVFIDGGFSLKIPFRALESDTRFQSLTPFLQADKTIVFCCDPQGFLWETSMRLQSLNRLNMVKQALQEHRMFIIFPDHPVEAGFLSYNNAKVLRTFERGREQARRVLSGKSFRKFLEA